MKNLFAFLITVVALVIAVPTLNQNESAKNKLFDIRVFQARHSMSISDKKLTKPDSWGSMKDLSDSTSIVTLTNRKNCSSCVCGRANLANEQTRIVGGHDVKNVNQYPWMAQLRRTSNGEFACGGSLLNSKYVLTAAHCVRNKSENDLFIRLLAHHENDTTGNKLINRKVKHILRHDSYSSVTGDSDIALIRLDEEVELGNTVDKPSPICLPAENSSYTGMDGVVIGWGSTYNDSSSSILQEVRVPIISNEDCKTGYDYTEEQITSNMICAVHPNGGKGSCTGDSGGPLMVITGSTTQSYYLAGAVSFGGPVCGHPQYPGVYTKVDNYLKWIKDNIKGACSC